MDSNDLKVGTRVRFLNDVGGGIVVGWRTPEEVLVETEDGFEMPYPPQELLVVENPAEEAERYQRQIPSIQEILNKEVSPEQRRRLERDFDAKYKDAHSRTVGGKQDLVEVDLHLHELVDSSRGLSNSAMLDLQLSHFERMLQMAIRERQRRIVFIHGIGQGVLRHAILTRITQFYPECDARPADPRKYGSGATEIYIRQAN